MPPWTPGVLDIHQIHTGGGNAALLIFPDGTSLLVDAGDGNPQPPRGAVDAAVLNHHGIGDGTTESFVRGLRPRVWIIPARAAGHPDRWVLNRLYSTRIYPGPRDVFSLTLQEATRQIVGEPLAGLKSQRGHIVLRVAEHGKSYLVVILDDASEANTVKAVHGPYEAR